MISKGYHVTEACVLTKTGHPASFFSELHSSLEKSFTSSNHVTFAAMERGRDLFSKATYIMDRGYDNKMFCKLMELEKKVHFQYYRIASGIAELLKHAKEGVRLWFKPLRPDQRQLRIKLT